MALIPNQGTVTIGQVVEVVSAADQTTRTYKIDLEAGRVAGFVDRREAMEQAIFKVFETERFKYLTYSWNYGFESEPVFGKCYPGFASEIKRLIREALLADSRITDAVDFTVERIDKRTARVVFTAETVFGAIPIERTVNISV